MAWIADSVIVSIATWLLVSSVWTVGVTFESATTLLRLAAWSWLVSVIYYLVLEGGWGASLGKRLMAMRVTSPIDDRWWRRIGLRTVVFHVPVIVPTLFFTIATGGSILPGVVYTANTAPSGWTWNGPPTAWLSLLLTILLFSTARRGNGWTGVHELLSRTRVVQRSVVRPVASAAPKAPVDLVPALSSMRHLGPYAVHTLIGVLAVAVILPSYARSLQGASPEQRAHLSENFPSGGEAIRRLVGSGFASIPVSIAIGFGLMSVLAVPGGLVTRALRHAVVRRDGCEIGRVRSAVRFLIAWSPALVWIGCVGVPMFGTPHVSASVAFVRGSLAFLVMAAGAAWTIAIPARGPHDRIVGTWVVPR
jgi:hypothetical protein